MIYSYEYVTNSTVLHLAKEEISDYELSEECATAPPRLAALVPESSDMMTGGGPGLA
jgi:hypothetical protein